MKEIVIPWSLSSAWPYKSPASAAGNQAGHGLGAGAPRRRTGHPFGMTQLQEVTESEHRSYAGQPDPKTPSSATTDPPQAPPTRGFLRTTTRFQGPMSTASSAGSTLALNISAPSQGQHSKSSGSTCQLHNWPERANVLLVPHIVSADGLYKRAARKLAAAALGAHRGDNIQTVASSEASFILPG